MHLEIAVKNAVVQEIRNLEICSFELVLDKKCYCYISARKVSGQICSLLVSQSLNLVKM